MDQTRGPETESLQQQITKKQKQKERRKKMKKKKKINSVLTHKC